MTATNHALTGALVATLVKQPLLGIPLAFASHFICDALPHFGVNLKFGSVQMYRWLAVDGVAAILFAVLLVAFGVSSPVYLAVSGFAAMSPDLAWLYYGLKGSLGKRRQYDLISRFHSRIQWYQKVPGLYIEAFWAALMVLVIIKVQ